MEMKRSVNVGKARAGKIVAAAGLALGGLMTTGVGISHADEIQTPGRYPSREACQAAGPGVEAATGLNWKNFWCAPDPAATGVWRLVLTN